MLLQVSQSWSQLPSQSWSQPSTQSPSQSESHGPSQLPPKTEQSESQLPSHPELQLSSQTQLESHDPSQLPSLVQVPESLRAKGGHASNKVICKRGRGAGGQTDQLPEQPEAFSCRRAPSIPPVIADSSDGRDEALSSDEITQPWTVESVIARWKSIAYRGPCIDLLRAWSVVEDLECSGDVLTYDAVRARAARKGNTGDSLRC